MEKELLAAVIKNRENFNKINKIGYDIKEDLSEFGREIYSVVNDYYETDTDAQSVPVAYIGKTLDLKHETKPAVRSLFKEALSNIEQLESPDNLFKYALRLRKTRVGHQLSSALLGTSDQDVERLINDYSAAETILSEKVDSVEIVNTADLETIFSPLHPSHKIRILPGALNDVLRGGAIKGHNVILFGRPEMGKTLFVLNLVAGWLADNLKVLYFGNEDPMQAIVARLISRLVGIPTMQLEQFTKEEYAVVWDKLMERGYQNFFFKELAPGSMSEVKTFIEEIEPDVVVYDQIRHIKVGNLEKVQQMEAVAMMARNYAKQFNHLAVGITQAGDSADKKLILEMGDIDFSNTGMQGAVDLLIGIGANDEFMESNRRMLSICKNKITGTKVPIPVLYDIPINKVLSL